MRAKVVGDPVRPDPGTDDKTWYNAFYQDRGSQDLLVPPEVVERYSKLPHASLFQSEKWHQLIGDVRGKRILYIACGVETSGILLALRGGEVWVFDLAVEAIREQRKMGLANRTASRTRFVVGSCGHLPFRPASFDVVVGIGVWHHLQEDLDTPCGEVARVLKEDGLAVFEEPIARSDLLARLRKHVPIPAPCDASPRCRPLAGDALACFSPRFHLEAHWFAFVARLGRFVVDDYSESTPRWQRRIIFALHYIDFLLLEALGFDRLAAVVIFRLTARRERLDARGLQE